MNYIMMLTREMTDQLVEYDEVYDQYALDHANSPLVGQGENTKDPKLQLPAIQARWQQLGLMSDPKMESFASNVEFISLGCFCGPARALQLLGLRKRAYPLDFMRSDVYGVIHLLKTQFNDFFNVRGPPKPGVVPSELTYETTWGGSFWHHDITDQKTKNDLQRRVDRLLGKDPKVPLSRPRVFVHAVNGSAGFAHTKELYDALQKMLGKQTPVYMLTLIDNQDEEEMDTLHYTSHPNHLFFKVPATIWRSSNFTGLDSLAEMYCHGIAKALFIWTQHEAGQGELSDLRHLGQSLRPFYANSPATHLFNVIEGEPNLEVYMKEHREDVESAYSDDDDENYGPCHNCRATISDTCIIA